MTDTRPASLTEKIFLALAVILIAMAAYLQWSSGDGGDKGWLLLAARMWLSGKRLYLDIFETNMPLIIWVYSIPAWLSLHLEGIQDVQLLHLMVLLAVGCSLLLTDRLMRFHPAFAPYARKRAWHTILLGFILVLWANPAFFGDREHLFLVLALPYIMRCSPSLARIALPLPLRLGVACMGAVGFCIKPHCVMVFLGIQVLALLRERSLRFLWSLENCIIGAAGLAYLLSARLLVPEFFHDVLPMELASYGGYNMGAIRVMFFIPPLLTLGAAFADFRLRDVSPYRRDILYFAVICALLLLYVFVNNGWGYTFYPLGSMALFLTAWLWWEFRWLKQDAAVRGVPFRRATEGSWVCALVLGAHLMLTLLPYALVYSGAMPVPKEEPDIAMDVADFMKKQQFHTFGGMAATFRVWPVLNRTLGAQLETRFHCLWMIPSFVMEGEGFVKKNAWIPAYVAKALAEDMEKNKPEVMFVDTSPEFFHSRKPLDLVAYFSVVPAFREAWKHYAWLQRIDHCDDKDSSGNKKEQFKCRYDAFRRIN